MRGVVAYATLRGMMNLLGIGVLFDVDGTLVNDRDRPNWATIDLLWALHGMELHIGVWSGGGKDYAEHWVRKLGLGDWVYWCGAKGDTPPFTVLLTVDDGPEYDFGFGVPNIIVPR